MAKPDIEVTLITANVGSVISKPKILDGWIESIVKAEVTAMKKKPGLLALHCQGVGGKSFGTAIVQVERLIHGLHDALAGKRYTTMHGFVDPVSDASKFTGLASFYFVHDSIAREVCIWDFQNACFKKAWGDILWYDDDLDTVGTVHKYKFPAIMTPGGQPSRSGFLRTRWRLHAKQDPIELVNVYLSHDESNLIAMKEFPSSYTRFRRAELQDFLRRIGGDHDDNSAVEDSKYRGAFFIFGDFNFRLDTGAVVSWLTEDYDLQETEDASGNVIRKEFHEHTSGRKTLTELKKLTIEEKLFKILLKTSHEIRICKKQCSFCVRILEEFHSHDKELEFFNKDLHEFKIDFPPSYCYSEEPSKGAFFGETSCPAWCDRVLFNGAAEELVSENLGYDLIGKYVCMGDHKPVVLRIRIGGGGKEEVQCAGQSAGQSSGQSAGKKKKKKYKFCGQS